MGMNYRNKEVNGEEENGFIAFVEGSGDKPRKQETRSSRN